MILKSTENTYIEYRDRLTVGEKERFKHAQTPKLKTNEKGEMVFDIDQTYENSPNFYILSRIIKKVIQDGVDITPKDNTVTSLLEMMDDKLYDDELINNVLKDVLEKNGFLEPSKTSPKSKKTTKE